MFGNEKVFKVRMTHNVFKREATVRCSVGNRKLLVCACVMGLQNNCTGRELRTQGISSSPQKLFCVTCLRAANLFIIRY